MERIVVPKRRGPEPKLNDRTFIESTVAEAIIANHARGKAFIADTGYDSDAIRDRLKSLHIKPVICAIAPRFEKTARNYLALLQCASRHRSRT